mgnify:CR=1 FL=1
MLGVLEQKDNEQVEWEHDQRADDSDEYLLGGECDEAELQ